MHLSETLMDVIAYVVYFLKTAEKKQPPYDQVMTKIVQLLSESQRTASDFSPEDYDQARFAICAWIDEAIMNSPWHERITWQREPLQLRFYKTTNAGELFFERLNTLAPHQNDVREVYYLCLAIGFMGRYCKDEDRFLLDQLKTSNLKVLTGSSISIPTLRKGELFPEAYPAETAAMVPRKAHTRFSLIDVSFVVFPAALFGALYIIYVFVLSNVSHTLFNLVP